MTHELLITVVSVRNISYFQKPSNLIYIGRRVGSWPRSPLANAIKLDHEGQRTWVICQYKEWLWEKIKANDPKVTDELARIAGMVKRGEAVQLGCWCSPKPCHGDAVKDAVLWWIKKDEEMGE